VKSPEIVEFADDALVPIKRASELLGITDRRIRDLAKDGYIPKDSRGLVPLVGAIQGYIRFLKDEERRTAKSAAAADVQKARAEQIRLRIAREQGLLIYTDSCERVVSEVLGAFRQRLVGVPAASTRDLTIRQAIEDNIERAVAEARADFAKKREELLEEAKKGRRE
jgi:phage terminase Nu1 subunit (DNA packaging protein)